MICLRRSDSASPGFFWSCSVGAIPGLQATQNPPPAQNPPVTPASPPTTTPQPVGGSAQPGPGRGGRGNPAAGLVTQFCASCHGPTLQGGSAASLMDEDWKFGGDDDEHHGEHPRRTSGHGDDALQGPHHQGRIRQLVFYIRDQAGQLKGKPRRPRSIRRVLSSRLKSRRSSSKSSRRDSKRRRGLAFLPDGRLLVTERPGRLRIVDKGNVLPPVTGTPTVWVRQDGGMFDVEVHPDYARTGSIYLSFSETLPGYKAPEPDPAAAAAPPQGGRGGPPTPPSMTVIVRGKIRDNAWVDEQVNVRRAQPSSNRPRTSTTAPGLSSTSRAIFSIRSATRANPRALRISRHLSVRFTASMTTDRCRRTIRS